MNSIGLYVIISEPVLPYDTIARICVKTGIRALQLREKAIDDRALLRAAGAVTSVTRGTGTSFFINDRIDLALAAGADGVHLGQDDLPIEAARRIAGDRPLLYGLSTHSIEQARSALAFSPDYIGFGPIHATPTKAKPDPVVGLAPLAGVLGFARVPVVAIGGIDDTNLDAVLDTGVRDICLVRFLMRATDIEERIRYVQARLAAKPSGAG